MKSGGLTPATADIDLIWCWPLVRLAVLRGQPWTQLLGHAAIWPHAVSGTQPDASKCMVVVIHVAP